MSNHNDLRTGSCLFGLVYYLSIRVQVIGSKELRETHINTMGGEMNDGSVQAVEYPGEDSSRDDTCKGFTVMLAYTASWSLGILSISRAITVGGWKPSSSPSNTCLYRYKRSFDIGLLNCPKFCSTLINWLEHYVRRVLP